MRIFLALSILAVAHCQTPDAIVVTISAQQSPYPLPKGLLLYSFQACSPTSTRVRAISAGQVRQVFEAAGGNFQDPSLLSLMVTRYVQRTVAGRMLGTISYVSTGGSIASAALAVYKSGAATSNAKTWAEAATILGTLGAAVPIAQKALQGDVAAQQATITNGVKAALMLDMGEMSTVPVGGCSGAPHRMFVGSGPTTAKGVIQ